LHRFWLHCPLVGIAATALPAAAQPEQEPEAEIIVVNPSPPSARERDDDRALAEPGLVTRIRVDDRTAPSATLAEVLATAAGAQVRSLGGLGGFASVSVRGLGPGHTPVSIDGVPLSRVAGVITDLSRFDLHSFSAVELYRGAVPIDLPAGGLGGALNLVTEVGPGDQTDLSIGAGSFGARHLRARHLGGGGDLGYALSAGYAGAEGDYEFFNDNGTNLNPDDDATDRRENNGFDRLDLTVRAREAGHRRVARGGARLALKRQGLPGLGTRQTTSAELDTASGVLDASVDRRWGDRGTARASGFAMFDRFHLRDPDGEVGLGADDTVGESLSVGAGLVAGSQVSRHLELVTGSVDARVDGFGERNRQTGAEGARGIRGGATLGAQARIAAGSRVALVPSVRLEILDTRPRGGDAAGIDHRTDVDASPRLAALIRPTVDLSLKASAGYAVRQPTLVELFGDRGYAAGNPMLLAERGPAGDAGVVWLPVDPPGPLDRLFVEVAGFWARPDDAIVYFPTAGQVARPFNVGGARIAGLESSAQIVWRRLAATASYTFTDARDRDTGNPLPNRARHQLYGRLDGSWWRLSAWTDASHASGNTLDRAATQPLPARTFIGAGVAARLNRWLSLSVEGKNLADETVERVELDPAPRPDLTSAPRAVSDFFGYPLPGRAFYASLRALF
jgi:iron complex outermembrane receptor protein